MGKRAQKQRKALLTKAARALSQNPRLVMGDLAQEMEVSRATLYRYFPTRDVLIKALSLEALRATDEAVEGIYEGVTSYKEAFRRTIEALIPLGAYYHFLSREGQLSRRF